MEPQTVTPLADTYVDSSSVSTAHGLEEYLKVSDNNIGMCIALLMFSLSGVSRNSNVTFEAKLRLFGCTSNLTYVIGAHWCANNTWNEETFAFVNFSSFVRTRSESNVTVGSENVWHEWVVTDLVNIAMRENYENITFGLEAEQTVQGNAFAIFYSREQQQLPPTYNPQLVFTYHDITGSDGGVSLDTIGKVVFGGLVTAGIVFIAYRSLKKTPKRRRRLSYTHAKINVA